MTTALLLRFEPAGPWRFGPGQGGRDRIDPLYRSDRLFSAVTLAFERMGMLDGWLEATARAQAPGVVFSSLFPFQGDTLFAPPPATLWPPPAAAVRMTSPVFSTKVRWRAARFVPLSLIETLLSGQRLLADQWVTDAESGCLLRRDRPQSSPFRIVKRAHAAVDRLGAGSDGYSIACAEFEPGSGLWAIAGFEDEQSAAQWKEPLLSAFRLLADTGMGGRRSSGWGQIAKFSHQDGSWPHLLLPRLGRGKANSTPPEGDIPKYWLLSLFSPGSEDHLDWSEGRYSLTMRGGHIESAAGYGMRKKRVRMVEEGSVLAGARAPRGAAVDVAPEGFQHPVYRAGFALAVALPSVEFAAVPEEPPEAPGELVQALDEALRAAAEELVTTPEPLEPPSETTPQPEEEDKSATGDVGPFGTSKDQDQPDGGDEGEI